MARLFPQILRQIDDRDRFEGTLFNFVSDGYFHNFGMIYISSFLKRERETKKENFKKSKNLLDANSATNA